VLSILIGNEAVSSNRNVISLECSTRNRNFT